jgi:hypothetical protein
MTITVEKITEIDDDIYDSLYADCVDDLGAGSMPFPTGVVDAGDGHSYGKPVLDADGKKTYMKNRIKADNHTHILLFKKDDTPIMLTGGYIQDYAFYENGDYRQTKHSFTNLFLWNKSVVGEHDGSKNWCRTSEFYNAWKTYLLSIGAEGYMIDAMKGSPVAVHFKQSQADGIPLGTYTLHNVGTDTMIWVY